MRSKIIFNQDRITIKKFDLSSIKSNATIFIMGPRRSGKSTIKKHLIYDLDKKHKFNIGKAWNGTLESMKDLKWNMPPSTNVKYCKEDFQRVIRAIEANESKITNDNKKLLLVLDDCSYDDKLFKLKEMNELFCNGRHLRITNVTCAQYCMSMPPALRQNIDYIFVTKQNKPDVREKIYKYYFGMVPKYIFDRILDVTTKDYGVLVLDNTGTANTPEKMFYHFKADINILENNDFKLFDKKFWRMDKHVFPHLQIQMQAQGQNQGQAQTEGRTEGRTEGQTDHLNKCTKTQDIFDRIEQQNNDSGKSSKSTRQNKNDTDSDEETDLIIETNKKRKSDRSTDDSLRESTNKDKTIEFF